MLSDVSALPLLSSPPVSNCLFYNKTPCTMNCEINVSCFVTLMDTQYAKGNCFYLSLSLLDIALGMRPIKLRNYYRNYLRDINDILNMHLEQFLNTWMVCSQFWYDNILMLVFLYLGDDSSIGKLTFILKKGYLYSINWEWDLSIKFKSF